MKCSENAKIHVLGSPKCVFSKGVNLSENRSRGETRFKLELAVI